MGADGVDEIVALLPVTMLPEPLVHPKFNGPPVASKAIADIKA